MPAFSFRSVLANAFLGCLAVFAIALYLEHGLGLIPCPLCMVQRIVLLTFAALCFIGALHNPKALGARLYASALFVLSSFGAATAARQLWLQSLPKDQLPSCIPPLDFLLDTVAFTEVVRLLLQGTADCAKISWTFLSLSIAHWSFLLFASLSSISLWKIFFPSLKKI